MVLLTNFALSLYVYACLYPAISYGLTYYCTKEGMPVEQLAGVG